MKNLSLLIAIVLLSCSFMNNKETVSDEGGTIGEVRITEDCIYIEAQIDGEALKMYPVFLADEFKLDGTEIRFDYALSRAPQPTNCPVDMTVSLTNVSKI